MREFRKEDKEMIKFTNEYDNQQFILIAIDSSKDANVNKLISKIKAEYPSIQALHIIFDESEILIPLTNDCNYGFSLNQLREYLNPIAAATVSHFCVDMDEPTQRYNG